MGGQRAFFQQHALEAALVIFEQLGRAEIAGDQDRILLEPHRGGRAHLAGDDPQQPVGEILQIVHPVGQQGIVDLAHPHPGALLDAFDRRFGGQARVDRLDDPAAPPFVIGEHLVGLEHFLVLAANAEFGLAGHPVDLFAHLVKGQVDALQFGIAILGHGVFDGDAWLVEHRHPAGQPLDQAEPGQVLRPGLRGAE